MRNRQYVKVSWPALHCARSRGQAQWWSLNLIERKEKTMPFGVSLMRSQVSYRADQVLFDSLMPQQGVCMAGWYDMPENNKQARPKLNETCKMLQGAVPMQGRKETPMSAGAAGIMTSCT